MSKARPPLVVIAGPTASGKSALAMACASRLGGVIVNADASQLYSDLPILSAAPSANDLRTAEHRLYGIRSGDEPFSAAEWAALAKAEIERIHDERRIAVLVGGTGLYIRTLVEGIAPVPPIDAAIREAIRASSVEANYRELRKLDPAAAERLKPTDKTRIARALEVIRSTGRTLADWQADRKGGIGDEVTLRPIALTPPRDWLYARCDRRFAAMVEQGAVGEVEALLARRLDPDLPVMRAIGVREIAAFLRGETDRATMIAAGQQATRRYAKRQYTWFAHQPPPSWPRISEPPDSTAGEEHSLELLGVQQ